MLHIRFPVLLAPALAMAMAASGCRSDAGRPSHVLLAEGSVKG
jgi:hypothetical protein